MPPPMICYDAVMTNGPAYQDLIAIEPGTRGGRPCLRGTRIAVADVLGWLAEGMSEDQIADEFPEVTARHVRACLSYAAARERRVATAAE